MAETAMTFVKWGLRIGFILAGLFAFIGFLSFAVQAINNGLDGTIIGDLYALVQIWLPFNISTVMLWITTAAVLYITYKLAVFSINYLNKLIGDN